MALPPQPDAQRAAKKRLQNADNLNPHEHLLALREATGLSQDKLAGILGSQGPNVHAWENGDKRPVGATWFKIEAWSRQVARALGLPESSVLVVAKWLTDEERKAADAIGGAEVVS